LIPRLIAAFGTRRERYESAYQLQCYSGIAPVKVASGRTQLIRFRRACPKFLRQTFHEYALHSIQKSEWARAYYQLQRDRHKSHHAAVRSLAYKWIRIIFRCWKDRKPYDEAIYLQSQRRRSAMLGADVASVTAAGWRRSPALTNSPRFPLDGLAQKTPGLAATPNGLRHGYYLAPLRG